MGGLARLASAVRNSRLNGKPVLIVDYGNSLSSPPGFAQARHTSTVSSKIIIETFKELKYDFINIGEGEILAGRAFLEKTPSPVLLSSNLRDSAGKKPIFRDFITTEAAGFKFLFAGVFPKDTPALKEVLKKENITVIDPAEALTGIVASQKGKFDFLIVLSSMKSSDNELLAKNFPDIALIIGAKDHAERMSSKENETVFLANLPKGQSISKLTLTVRGKNKRFTDLSRRAELKDMLERIDSTILTIRNSGLDYGAKRVRISNLAARRDEFEKELKLQDKNLKDPAMNICSREQLFLNSGISEDRKTRQSLDSFYKRQKTLKDQGDPKLPAHR